MDRHDWDRRYDTPELIWRAEPNRFLVAEVAGLAPGSVLDLACGEGRNAVWLAERGWRATGVDFSAVGIDKARRLAAERGVEVELLTADVLEWQPPGATFDLVIAFYLQLPAEERRRAIALAAGALAPGGTLLVVGHDSTNLTEGTGGPQDPGVLFTPEDLAADVAAAGDGVVVERAERVRRPVQTESGEVDAIDALLRARRVAAA